MPKQPNYLTTPAVIAKSDIAKMKEFKGCANAMHFRLADAAHEPGTIQFVTFSGARRDDGKYAGEYRFVKGDFKDAKRADLNQLPSERTKVTPEPVKKAQDKAEGLSDGV